MAHPTSAITVRNREGETIQITLEELERLHYWTNNVWQSQADDMFWDDEGKRDFSLTFTREEVWFFFAERWDMNVSDCDKEIVEAAIKKVRTIPHGSEGWDIFLKQVTDYDEHGY